MDNKAIWDMLYDAIGNPYGVAGLMGNLMAESSMNPICKTGGSDAIKKMSSQQYVDAIKSGTISTDEFIHDGVAFGYVQWCYWSRKESFVIFAGTDRIDDPSTQLLFMLSEIKSYYKTVWSTLLTAKSVREASDTVMLKYEKPAGTGESAKQKREAYGQKYFDEFAVSKKLVATTANRVLVRAGNGKNYKVLTRVEKKGTTFDWVATSEDGWHAISIGSCVGWISGEFSELR